MRRRLSFRQYRCLEILSVEGNRFLLGGLFPLPHSGILGCGHRRHPTTGIEPVPLEPSVVDVDDVFGFVNFYLPDT